MLFYRRRLYMDDEPKYKPIYVKSYSIKPAMGGIEVDINKKGDKRIYIFDDDRRVFDNIEKVLLEKNDEKVKCFLPIENLLVIENNKKTKYTSKRPKYMVNYMPFNIFFNDLNNNIKEEVEDIYDKLGKIRDLLNKFKFNIYIMDKDDPQINFSVFYLNIFYYKLFYYNIVDLKNNPIPVKIYLPTHERDLTKIYLIHELGHLVYKHYAHFACDPFIEPPNSNSRMEFHSINTELKKVFSKFSHNKQLFDKIREGYYFNKSAPQFGNPYDSPEELFTSIFTLAYIINYELEKFEEKTYENISNIRIELPSYLRSFPEMKVLFNLIEKNYIKKY